MATKQPTSISLTAEQRQAIKDAQDRLAKRDGELPSRNRVVREALSIGLPRVGNGREEE